LFAGAALGGAVAIGAQLRERGPSTSSKHDNEPTCAMGDLQSHHHRPVDGANKQLYRYVKGVHQTCACGKSPHPAPARTAPHRSSCLRRPHGPRPARTLPPFLLHGRQSRTTALPGACTASLLDPSACLIMSWRPRRVGGRICCKFETVANGNPDLLIWTAGLPAWRTGTIRCRCSPRWRRCRKRANRDYESNDDGRRQQRASKVARR
jgi:hypothetical protein